MKKEREYKMAMDDERFCKWFQLQYNAGVDPHTIKKTDRNPPLAHIYENGVIQRTTPYRFFYGKWETPKRTSRKLAMGDLSFKNWFQGQYNLGVNPYILLKSDKEPVLVHVFEDGTKENLSPYDFFNTEAKRHKSPKKHKKSAEGKGKLAMDDERFKTWYQPQYNPGVDPYTLRKADTRPSLIHVYENHAIQKLSPYRFFYENWKVPKKPRGHMAMEHERFREWFQPAFNEGVNPYALKTTDREPELVHVNEDGSTENMSAYEFFHRKKSRGSGFAMDDERFRQWFQPEYNKEIDPWKLRKYDKETRLVHYNENGIVRRTTCMTLFTAKNWDTVKSRNSFAMEYREFREWYQPEHNVGVDPWSLKKSDEETPMKHVYEDGTIQNYTARQVFAQKAWLPRKFRHQLAIYSPTFKEWYQPEHNLGVNIKKLYKSDAKTKLTHVFEDGTVQKTTAFSLFFFNRWDAITPEYKLAMEYP